MFVSRTTKPVLCSWLVHYSDAYTRHIHQLAKFSQFQYIAYIANVAHTHTLTHINPKCYEQDTRLCIHFVYIEIISQFSPVLCHIQQEQFIYAHGTTTHTWIPDCKMRVEQNTYMYAATATLVRMTHYLNNTICARFCTWTLLRIYIGRLNLYCIYSLKISR